MSQKEGSMVRAGLAVTELLRDGTFHVGLDFTPKFSWAEWTLPLKEAKVLRVDVVPVNHMRTELVDRESVKYEPGLDIAVRYKFASPTEEETDDGLIKVEEINNLAKFVEDIHEHLCSQCHRELRPNLNWNRADIKALCLRQHLRDLRQFTGLIRVVFDVHKKLK